MSSQDDLPESAHLNAVYANHFRVGYNAFEFLLDFGQREPESDREFYHTRVVTSPEHLERFLEIVIQAAETHPAAEKRKWTASPSASDMSAQQVRSGSARTEVVLQSLANLDDFLRRAFVRAQEAFEPQEGGEARPLAYRGLHISKEEAAQLVAQAPAVPAISATSSDPDRLEVFSRTSPWGAFAQRFGLTAFDQAVLAMALAPEVDLRYERVYAYLQDDVTRRHPAVSLALDVLCPNAQAKAEWRSRFAPGAPLLRSGLLRLTPDPNHVSPSWLDHYLTLDEQAVAYALGDTGLSSGLLSFCEVVEPAIGKRIEGERLTGLVPMVIEARARGQLFPVCFHGPRGTRQREAAEAIAAAAGAKLVVADLDTGIATADNYESVIRSLYLHAALLDAMVFLDPVDTLLGDAQGGRLACLLRTVRDYPCVTILCTSRPWVSSGPPLRGILNVGFALPDFQARRAVWQTQLAAAGFPDDPALLDALASRFSLTHDQIVEAVMTARNRLQWDAAIHPGQPKPEQPYAAELMAAARGQTGHDLAALALKVKPVYGWKDIVLSAEAEAQLHEICERVSQRRQVFDEWGFDEKLSQGKGVTVLFTGPSGSGKTMAAEVIANALGIDMYKIDLSGVVSKYIGETEKNLERIFTAAERTNAILFFDEADALFGKRSEVHDAHDRYANIEISYLLQRMEQYDGIAILATNLRANLDDAFARRLAYAVRFTLPEEAERLKIWRQIWPSADLLATEVDLGRLAAQFKLSGGNIKNIALAASFFAATAGGKVTMTHLLRALGREYEKVGKTVSQAELEALLAPVAPAKAGQTR